MVGREQTSRLPLATLSHGRSRPPVTPVMIAGCAVNCAIHVKRGDENDTKRRETSLADFARSFARS